MTMITVHITDESFLGNVKHALRSALPATKLGHLDEAVAAGFGYRSRAAALAALRGGAATVAADGAAFAARLSGLGTDAAPGLFPKTVEALLDDASECGVAYRVIEEEAGADDKSDEDGWTPPWELDEDDPLRMSWEHMENSRGWR